MCCFHLMTPSLYFSSWNIELLCVGGRLIIDNEIKSIGSWIFTMLSFSMSRPAVNRFAFALGLTLKIIWTKACRPSTRSSRLLCQIDFGFSSNMLWRFQFGWCVDPTVYSAFDWDQNSVGKQFLSIGSSMLQHIRLKHLFCVEAH